VPRWHHFSFTVEVGIVFMGKPQTKLALGGTACLDATQLLCVPAATDAIIQQRVAAEQNQQQRQIRAILADVRDDVRLSLLTDRRSFQYSVFSFGKTVRRHHVDSAIGSSATRSPLAEKSKPPRVKPTCGHPSLLLTWRRGHTSSMPPIRRIS
jgi:hypothetical protein